MSREKILISELLETISHLSKFPNEQEILLADPKAVDQTEQRRRADEVTLRTSPFLVRGAPSQYATPLQRTEHHEGGG